VVVDDGIVIVGASLAGAKAAEAAREAGWEGPIRLVGAEAHLPYERPPLSKSVLIGKDPPASSLVHEPGFDVTQHVDLLLGARAERLDLGDRSVSLEGGRTLRFAKLVLATGSTPRTLDIPGGGLPEVFTLRTIDDCLALRERLLPGRRLAVVGASWIGTEVAACARQRGCDVVMAEPLSTPLERVLGPEVGRWFAALHADHGVELRLGIGVTAITGDEHVEGLRLADGTVVAADTVVIGVGVRPNVELARDAGLDVDTGVRCGADLVTSHPDVLVAGDIAEQDHPLLGQAVRVEHWANALNQGSVAGTNAAGGHQTYDRIPYFFSDQYDAGMEYSGWPVPWDDVVFRGDPAGNEFVGFYLRGGRVVGGINVNVWDVNEHIQHLVRTGAAPDAATLTDLNVAPGEWSAATS
jgi:3-phenylpropionate/trans-cinnamate dioxygenase ferredoxin reductase subunit